MTTALLPIAARARPRLPAPGARALLLLLLAALVLYPPARLGWESLHVRGRWTAAAYQDVLSSAATRTALWHTLISAALATLLAVGTGVALGWLVARTDLPFRGFATTLLLFPLVLPPFVHALAWLQAYGPVGLVPALWNAAFGGHALPHLFIGAVGVVLLLAFQGLPVAGLLTLSALSRLDPAGEEAARIAGAGPLRAFRDVTLPALLPSIVAAAGLVFVAAASDFGVPAVLGLPGGYGTLTTRIYSFLSFSASAASFTRSIALSALLGAGAGVLLLLFGLRVEQGGPGFGGRPAAAAGLVPLGRWRRPLAAFLLLAFLLIVVLPVIALLVTALTRTIGRPPLPDNLTLANFRRVLRLPEARLALRTSLWVSAAAAGAVTLLGLLIAAATRAGGLLDRLLPALAALPFGMPGSVTGVAFILGWGSKLPLVNRSLYGTAWLILLAYCARFLVFGVEPVRAVLAPLDPALEEAAAAAGAGRLRRLRDVLAPYLAPALAAAFLLVFLTALHELTVSSLLASPRVTTLGVAVLHLEQEGDVGATAALASLLVLLVALAAAALYAVSRGRRMQ